MQVLLNMNLEFRPEGARATGVVYSWQLAVYKALNGVEKQISEQESLGKQASASIKKSTNQGRVGDISQLAKDLMSSQEALAELYASKIMLLDMQTLLAKQLGRETSMRHSLQVLFLTLQTFCSRTCMASWWKRCCLRRFHVPCCCR